MTFPLIDDVMKIVIDYSANPDLIIYYANEKKIDKKIYYLKLLKALFKVDENFVGKWPYETVYKDVSIDKVFKTAFIAFELISSEQTITDFAWNNVPARAQLKERVIDYKNEEVLYFLYSLYAEGNSNWKYLNLCMNILNSLFDHTINQWIKTLIHVNKIQIHFLDKFGEEQVIKLIPKINNLYSSELAADCMAKLGINNCHGYKLINLLLKQYKD